MPKKIIIIGAGIAGLSAGCYGRMNGYETEIYESHNLPGGLCTSWKRKGYTVDGCIHWLTGSSPANPFYRIWEELGAVQNRRMIDHEAFFRFTDTDGRTFTVYNDVDKLEAHMNELSPRDEETTGTLCRLIRKFRKFEMPLGKPFELYNFFDIVPMVVRMMPYMKDMNFMNKTTLGDFARRFRDPLLREAFTMLLYDENINLTAAVFTLALLDKKAGGFPEGGSLAFARAIEKRYLDLGGRISYNSKVEKIRVESGKARGIRLSDGREIPGDYVISGADLKTTVYGMLDGRFVEPTHEELFNTCGLFPSCVQVSFGVKMNLSSQPDSMGNMIKLKDPLRIGNQDVEWFMHKNFGFDPTLSPKGKTVIQSLFVVEDFNYWEKLYQDRKAYKAEKERIAEVVAEELEKIFPGFRDAVEMSDVTTPMTYVHYTGNWKGTFMTWIIPPEKADKFRMVKKTLPGLDNFWLSGMWVQPPGGVPTGAMTSRSILQIICKRDKKTFVTSKP